MIHRLWRLKAAVKTTKDREALDLAVEALIEQPKIIRCKNCRHDNNCEIQYVAQVGSEFFCGAAELRGDTE